MLQKAGPSVCIISRINIVSSSTLPRASWVTSNSFQKHWFIYIHLSIPAGKQSSKQCVQSTDRGPEEETTRTDNLFVPQRTQRPLPPKGTLGTYILSSVFAELWNDRPLHTWASAWVGIQRTTARRKEARNHRELALRRVCGIPRSLMKWQK